MVIFTTFYIQKIEKKKKKLKYISIKKNIFYLFIKFCIIRYIFLIVN